MPFVSKQKGRMSALLKQKAKVGVERKPRKTFPVYDFGKRARDEPENLGYSQAQPQAQPSPSTSQPTGVKKIVPMIISREVSGQSGETQQ